MTAGAADHPGPLVAARRRPSWRRGSPGNAERLDWDAEQLAAHQRERLRELLATAIERSPFHARPDRAASNRRPFELSDLPRLPVMRKAGDDGRVRRGGHRPAAQPERPSRRTSPHRLRRPSLLLGEYVCLASGGSSGLRGVFVQRLRRVRGLRRLDHAPGVDADARARRPAARRRCARDGRRGFADPLDRLRGGAVKRGRRSGSSAPRPRRRCRGSSRLLKRSRPALLMGYPGKLAELATRARRRPAADLAPGASARPASR